MIQLSKLGIDSLNAMQQETMQAFRKSDNVVLLSPTGSGKTLAYLLPLIESLKAEQPAVQALVIVPSRELAMQTVEVVKQGGADIRALALYGGRPAMEEHRTLNGVRPQLLVGTPGRLLDHLTKGNFSADSIHTLVIDEFDKCLELGFRDEMSQIFAHLPGVRKRFLLSATDNEEITRCLSEYVRLDYLDSTEAAERIEQLYVSSPQKDKLETLADLLLSVGNQTSIVFVGFRESVERVAKFLRERGFVASSLHGGLEQRHRERELFRFVAGSTNILVSTDLAARGLDIQALDNVIHYHLPLNEQAFIHRNGRTARWDREGRSFIILGPEETLPPYVVADKFSVSHSTRSPQHPLWSSIYIGKGKKDKISKGDIAGFLMKVGGLDKDDVGRIDVRDYHSFVAINRKRTSETLIRLRGQKIKGIKTIFELMK